MARRANIIDAYGQFIERAGNVTGVESDDQFNKAAFIKYSQERNINFYSLVAKDEHLLGSEGPKGRRLEAKLGIIDRFSRTIRNKILWTTYKAEHKTTDFAGAVDSIVAIYNDPKGKGINGQTPDDVRVYRNKKQSVWKIRHKMARRAWIPISVGDIVRIKARSGVNSKKKALIGAGVCMR